MVKKIILGAFLVLVILTASIYIMMPDKVKISIEKTRAKYFVWEDEKWILAATEYVNLYDGTTKMRAKSRNLSTITDGEITRIIRSSKWKDNITTIQTYTFDSSLEEIESFPVDNALECINCEGKIVHYEIRDILYDGVTEEIISPLGFGHNMKIEWQDGAYYSKVFQQKVASDKIIIKYRPKSDYEVYKVRLSDPSEKVPMIYYRFNDDYTDEGDGNLSYTLVPVNSPVFVTGILDNAVNFSSGSNQYALNTTFAGSEITKIRTVDFWIKSDSTPVVEDNIFHIYNSTEAVYENFGMWITTADKLGFRLTIDGVYLYGGTVLSSSTITPGNWYHIVLVIGSGGAKLYINGNTTPDVTHANTSVMDTQFNSIIVGATYTSAWHLDGIVDNFALFDEEYDTDDVTYSYNSGVGRYFLINPEIQQEYPADNYYNGTTENPTIKFNLSAVDNEDLDTIELWANFTGTWSKNQTCSVSGATDSCEWSITLSNGDYIWGGRVNDTGNNISWTSTNYTIKIKYVSSIIELGSKINISANLSGVSTVCVDIDHPDYGINYTCGSPNAEFTFNISWFRKTELNDSSTIKNISWADGGNQTVYLKAHQYDEIERFTINVSGYVSNGTYPTNVKIYINDSLSNDIGLIFTENIILNELSNGKGIYNITFDQAETNITYLKIPKNAIVSSAFTNLSGYSLNLNESWNLSAAIYNSVFISTQDSSSTGLFFRSNGTRLYEIGDDENKIYQYTCTTGWDLSTCSYDIINLSTQDSYPTGLFFNGTGTKLYEIGRGGDKFYQYTCTTGWDLSTCSYDIINLSTQDGNSRGLFFRSDGTRLYEIGYGNDKFYQYTCATGWDLSTCSYDSVSISTQDSSSRGLFFRSGGTRLYEVGDSNDKFYQYTCATGWDLSTCSYDSVSISTQDSSSTGLFFRSDGTRLYEVGRGRDRIYQYSMLSYSTNPHLEIGTPDGIHEWNYTGEFNEINNKTEDFSVAINTSLSTCTADSDGYCEVPLYFVSQSSGIIQISDININYTSNPNPIILSTSLVSSFLGNSTNFANIPIKFESTRNGTLQISDIRFDYAGGNDTIEVLVYEDGDESNYELLYLINYYSSFYKNLPYSWTENVFFLPRTNSSKNITAYGQTDSIPLFNITTTNYGGMNLNLSIRINESFSCLNLTWNATGSTKPGITINSLNTSWQEIAFNLGYLNNTQVWLWADLDNCDPSTKRILNPEIHLESYCEECIWN